MRHVRSAIKVIRQRVAGSDVMLFLDYDGTLTPIVSTPEKAVLAPRARAALKALCGRADFQVVVISGRALADISKRVGLPGIIYAGSHGLELEGPKIRYQKVVSQRYRKLLERTKQALQEKLQKIQGVLIEDKGLVLTMHYRLVSPAQVPLVKTMFHETVAPLVACGQIRIKEGKKVIEIKPDVEWDKGKAALWLLARGWLWRAKKPLPIYIGDDITDEDAFIALKGRGVTVFVGTRKKTAADYFLKDPAEVQAFLEELSAIPCLKNRNH